jgi:hypothetical protein
MLEGTEDHRRSGLETKFSIRIFPNASLGAQASHLRFANDLNPRIPSTPKLAMTRNIHGRNDQKFGRSSKFLVAVVYKLLLEKEVQDF